MAASRFAGFYNANEYAYGCSAAPPPPLKVDIGNLATGAVSLILATGYVTLADGTIVYPLSTNAPVVVGIGTNAETVTPSAVSGSGQGYDAWSFTATFSNLHGTGDTISSGTFGLQEAINAANAAGGGVVIVDGKWFQNGGTLAILNAAVLPANGSVVVQNNGIGGGSVISATIVVPNAAVLTLFSAPTQLLAAPGAGNMFDVIDMVVENKFLTAAYAAGGAIQASYGTGVTVPATATIAATFLTSPVANQVIKVAGALASNLATAIVNKALFLAAATADFTTGAGSLRVSVTYRLLTGY